MNWLQNHMAQVEEYEARCEERLALLNASPINWSRFVDLGGDIDEVRVDALRHNDQRLARLAQQALDRR